MVCDASGFDSQCKTFLLRLGSIPSRTRLYFFAFCTVNTACKVAYSTFIYLSTAFHLIVFHMSTATSTSTSCTGLRLDIYHRQIKCFLGRRRDESVIICWLILHFLSATIFFHPKASAESSVLYNYTISVPASSEPHQQLAPFELF